MSLKPGEILAPSLGHAKAELAEALRSAPPSARRKAVLVAREIAVSQAKLEGKVITDALESLRHGLPMEEALQEQLKNLVARLDEEYLQLAEQDDDARKPDVLRLFSRARAASALIFAISEDDGQLHEAVYEAINVVDDAVTDWSSTSGRREAGMIDRPRHIVRSLTLFVMSLYRLKNYWFSIEV